MQNGLAGHEHICGIPGTIGGLIYMNGGSMRRSISENLISVTSIDSWGEAHTRDAASCAFAYRYSIFHSLDEIITAVSLRFEHGQPKTIRQKMLKILGDRRRKFPSQPNCGSVFKSDPKMYEIVGPPGQAIEQSGLKGLNIGGAQVSTLHANFIVNTGDAKAKDILTLINEVAARVEQTTGFKMDAEVIYVSSSGEMVPADRVNRQGD
jgi:UDP-N-acetylmuramate dehydrogenase